MKILIVYASESGTCQECADMLENELYRHEVTKYDVTKVMDFTLSPSDFDACVVGGPVRFGKLHRDSRKYIKKYKDKLLAKKCAYFLACGYTDKYEIYLKKSIPADLQSASVCCELFGGRLKPENARGLDKIFVKAARNSIISEDENEKGYEGEFERVLPEIVPENIKRLASALEQA